MAAQSSGDTLKAALALLKSKDRSVSQIRELLIAKGFSQQEIADTIGWLAAKGILNDKRLTEQIVIRNRLASRNSIQRKLSQAGLEPDSLDQEGTVMSNEHDANAMDALLAKKRYEPSERAKAGRFLYGKGFEEVQIEQALDRFFCHNGGRLAHDSEETSHLF